MPYRKQEFINGEIYHIVLKGIEGKEIFKNINDYYRGIFSIYEFNNNKAITIQQSRKIRARIKKFLLNKTNINKTNNKINKLDNKLDEIR